MHVEIEISICEDSSIWRHDEKLNRTIALELPEDFDMSNLSSVIVGLLKLSQHDYINKPKEEEEE